MKVYEAYEYLINNLTPQNLSSEQMQQLLVLMPIKMREDIALKTHTMVHYYGEEVAIVRRDEEDSALRAAPPGYDLAMLNGVNVGCGDRKVNKYLLCTDAHGNDWEIDSNHTYSSFSQFKCWAQDLPFKENSIDYIIALHILEHLQNPMKVVIDWLSMVKPGGGIGLVLPDWRYTWDARKDNNYWSHRWNPTPKLLKEIYSSYWSEYADLEYINTYKWKISFDIVLRKKGEFVPYDVSMCEQIPTGKHLFDRGDFLHSDD
jgi:predicted SAM-dependent methyltransferase